MPQILEELPKKGKKAVAPQMQQEAEEPAMGGLEKPKKERKPLSPEVMEKRKANLAKGREALKAYQAKKREEKANQIGELTAKAAKKVAAAKERKIKLGKDMGLTEEEIDAPLEEVAAPKQKKKVVKKVVMYEESDSEEEEVIVRKKKPAKKPARKYESDSEDEAPRAPLPRVQHVELNHACGVMKFI